MTSFEKSVEKWSAALKKSTDFDSWGQLVEASKEYIRLAKLLRMSAVSTDCADDNKKRVLLKIATCLETRSINLNSANSSEDIKLEDLKKLIPVLQSLTSVSVKDVPVAVTAKVEKQKQTSASNTPPSDNEDDIFQNRESYNSLLPKLNAASGQSLILVRILKIGLKDATTLIDPYFTVSCKDAAAVDLCKQQNTPVASERVENYLMFGVDVHIQVPLEILSKGSAIFFELFHYKHKRRSTSSKCFSFMELDELKPGPCVIELYRKPTDFRKKKLNLLTSKPLYLHLVLTITKQL
uniref:axin interactor, dorsalization-associated protein isoform X1 n=1 Tax=Ciona intestinalis TaxID=7719 RepID=UPI000180CED0|nr:axin interactor, dorsalization-associated protein isoform X1 [Ciona intestinalis]|eukprot:XP_002132148.1 axin interactor, dorsalization-associated protein isoform X1 [Ciona intestinalis]